MIPTHTAMDELSFWLGRAYYNYVGLLERVLADLGLDDRLRPGMGHVLFALFECDDRRIKDLAEVTELSPSTLTGMLDHMERNGIVVRHPDPADRRVVRVRLTPAGRALRPHCRRVLRRVNAVLGTGMPPADMKRLKTALAHVVGSMKRVALRAKAKRASAPKEVSA